MELDKSIVELKELRKEIPFHLYNLNTREVNYLKKMLEIIEKMEKDFTFTLQDYLIFFAAVFVILVIFISIIFI